MSGDLYAGYVPGHEDEMFSDIMKIDAAPYANDMRGAKIGHFFPRVFRKNYQSLSARLPCLKDVC